MFVKDFQTETISEKLRWLGELTIRKNEFV